MLKNMEHSEIFKLIEDRELMLVHTKESMEPKLLHVDTMILYDIPDGFLEYNKKYYWRKR